MLGVVWSDLITSDLFFQLRSESCSVRTEHHQEEAPLCSSTCCWRRSFLYQSIYFKGKTKFDKKRTIDSRIWVTESESQQVEMMRMTKIVKVSTVIEYTEWSTIFNLRHQNYRQVNHQTCKLCQGSFRVWSYVDGSVVDEWIVSRTLHTYTVARVHDPFGLGWNFMIFLKTILP